MKDYLIKAIIKDRAIRLVACNTTNLTNEARELHHLWPTASAALGRMMSATLMMGSNLKNDEKLSVTINGGGPIGTMITTTSNNGLVKGFVANPEVHYTYNDTGKLAVGVAVGHQGYLQVVKDMGLKEPFSSQVQLQTGEIGEDFAYYYAISEQIPTAISLGVLVDTDNKVIVSGGYMAQLMPGHSELDIQLIENVFANSLPVTELLSQKNSVEEILQGLFNDVEILDSIDLAYVCGCSKEQMAKAIKTVGKAEIENMIEEDQGCEIHCHFCNKTYHFNEDELKELID